MTQQVINVGSGQPGSGDQAPAAGAKINANFTENYAAISGLQGNVLAGSYTYATLPSAAANTGKVSYTTDRGPVWSDGVAWSGMAQASVAPYLGVVAIGGMSMPSTVGLPGSFSQNNSRTAHIAAVDITSLQAVFPNCLYDETGTGGTLTLTAALEYPGGTTATAFRFTNAGGTTSMVIPNGTMVTTDPLPCRIPKGATFYVRTFGTFTGTPSVGQNINTALGECNENGTSGLSDRTLATNGGTFSGANNAPYRPAALIGITDAPTLFLLGDSRLVSFSNNDYGPTDGGAPAGYMGAGELEHISTSQRVAAINAGSVGSSANALFTNRPLSSGMYVYCTHVVSNLGINDIMVQGRTAAQVTADLASIIATMARPFYVCTLGPRTTSSDSWLTLANQTSYNSGFDAQRVTYNTNLRAGTLPTGALGAYDPAAVVESSLNSGKWKVNNSTINWYTNDGIHEMGNAILALYNSNFYSARVFRR